MSPRTDIPQLLDVEHPTQQQIFDAVVEHAAGMTEKAQVTDHTGTRCVYRTEDNCNACFIGGLVTDDEARDMTAAGNFILAASINQLLAMRKSSVPERLRHPELRNLLFDLQNVHDGHKVLQWPVKLRETAHKYGLDAASVDRCFPATVIGD